MKRIRHPALRLDDEVSEKDEADLAHMIYAVLRQVLAQVLGQTDKLGKAEPAEERDQLSDLDLSRIRGLIKINEKTGTIAIKSSRKALDQISEDATYETVDENAITWARDRAASLVGMRYDGNGELVPSADVAYRIDDSTRDMLRSMIRDAVEQGLTNAELRDTLSEDYAFSLDRALTIARTESAFAHVAGAMIGYREAVSEDGLKLNKLWILGENACDICEANAAQGPIPIDENFESGDDAPPAHPLCRCDIAMEEAEEPDD